MSAPGGGVMSSSSASSGGGLALPAISSARVPLYASAVVGYRPVLSPACSWLTDSEVIFCGGPRSLIRLDLESRTQAVLSLGADVASISAFALAPSRRAIAVAEVSADGTPSVCVIEWPMTADETARSANLGMPLWAVAPGLPTPRRRRRVIADLAVGGVPVTALAFTPDSRFLLIGGGVTADGVSLTCVEWAKGPNGRVSCAVPNLFASASPNPPPPARISQLDVHPRDSMLIAVSAPGLFRLFRLTEGNAKSGIEDSLRVEPVIFRRSPVHFTAHTWLPDNRIVLGTITGDLFLFENNELIKTLDPPKAGLLPIGSMAPLGKGFLVGCEGGVLRFYEPSEDSRLYYEGTRGVAVRPRAERLGPAAAGTATSASSAVDAAASGAIARARSKVISVSTSANEDSITVATAGGDFMFTTIQKIEQASKAAAADGSIFSHVVAAHGFWSGSLKPGLSRAAMLAAQTVGVEPITGFLDGSARQPLAVLPAAACSSRPPPPTGVTGLDIALSRPIAVSIGADKRLCVWSLIGGSTAALTTARSSSEDGEGSDEGIVVGPGSGAIGLGATPLLLQSYAFIEPPLAVAVHPSGTFALVSTDSALSVCALMLDGVVVVKELPLRSIAAIKFAKTGGLVALAMGNNVVVLNANTLAPFTQLRGHTEKVSLILWDRDDRSIVSVSRDSDIRRWAVVVPNAVSGGVVPASPAGAVASAAAIGTEAIRASDPSAGTANASAGVTGFVGKSIATAAMKDLFPLAISLGLGAHDFILSGFPRDSSASTRVDAAPRVSFGVTGDPPAPPPGPELRIVDLSPPLFGANAAARSVGGNGGVAAQTSFPLEAPALAIACAIVDRADRGAGSIRGAARVIFCGMGHAPAALAAGKHGSGSATAPPHDPAGSLRAAALPLIAEKQEKGGEAVRAGRPVGAPVALDAPIAHGGPVTVIAVVPGNEGVVVTGGADGSIAVWIASRDTFVERLADAVARAPASAASAAGAPGSAATDALSVSDALSRPAPPPPSATSWVPYADEVIISRSTLMVASAERAALETRLAQALATQRFAMRARKRELEAELAAMHDQLEEELKEARATTDAVRELRDEAIIRTEKDTAQQEHNADVELVDLRVSYSSKLDREAARSAALEVATEQRMEAIAAEEAAKAAAHEAEMAALADALAAEQAEAAAKEAALTEMLTAAGVKAHVFSRAIEDDLDAELEALRAMSEASITSEIAAGTSLRGEHAFLARKAAAAVAAADVSKGELKAADAEEEKVLARLSSLRKDLASLHKEVRERDQLLGEKDTRISETKRTIGELEKFKFVLSYKLQELKRQVLPRKREIATLRATLNEMETELLTYHKYGSALELMVGELRVRRDGLAMEEKRTGSSLSASNEALVTQARDLSSIAALLREATATTGDKRAATTAARAAILHLYQKYIHSSSDSSSGKPSATLDENDNLVLPVGAAPSEVTSSVSKTRLALERACSGLEKEREVAKASAGLGTARLLRENEELLGQLNEKRRELRFAQKALEAARLQAAADARDTASTAAGHAHTHTPTSVATGPRPPIVPLSLAASLPSALLAAGGIVGGQSTRRSAALLGTVGAGGAGGGVGGLGASVRSVTSSSAPSPSRTIAGASKAAPATATATAKNKGSTASQASAPFVALNGSGVNVNASK